MYIHINVDIMHVRVLFQNGTGHVLGCSAITFVIMQNLGLFKNSTDVYSRSNSRIDTASSGKLVFTIGS